MMDPIVTKFVPIINPFSDDGEIPDGMPTRERVIPNPLTPPDIISGLNNSGSYDKLWVTMVTSVPFFLVLTASANLLLLTVLTKLTDLIRLHISAVFYAASMVFLMLTILVYWSLGLSSVSLKTEDNCKHAVIVQNTALTLPSYLILLVTAIRVVFVRRPLTYHSYLRLRYQAWAVLGIIVLVLGVNCIPLTGICGIHLFENQGSGKYCGYGEEGVECTVMKVVILVVCYLLPVTCVYTLYGVIHWTVLRSRDKNSKLTQGYVTSSTNTRPHSESTSSGSGPKTAAATKINSVRKQIPWCIVAVVSLYTVSTLPWMPMMLYPQQVKRVIRNGSYQTVIFDLLYSLLFLCTSVSPLTYLLTSQTLRREVKGMLKHAKNAVLRR